MNKYLWRILLLVFVMQVKVIIAAEMINSNWQVGLDYQYKTMQTNYSWNKIFKHYSSGIGVNVAWRFHDYWGLEMSYSKSSKAKDFIFNKGNNFFFNKAADTSFLVKSHLKIRSWNADLKSYWPVNNNMELFGSIGLSLAKPKLNIVVPNTSGTLDNALNSVVGKAKILLRVGIGAQTLMLDLVGIRGMISLINTEKFKATFNQNMLNTGATNKIFKNSVDYLLGIFIIW